MEEHDEFASASPTESLPSTVTPDTAAETYMLEPMDRAASFTMSPVFGANDGGHGGSGGRGGCGDHGGGGGGGSGGLGDATSVREDEEDDGFARGEPDDGVDRARPQMYCADTARSGAAAAPASRHARAVFALNVSDIAAADVESIAEEPRSTRSDDDGDTAFSRQAIANPSPLARAASSHGSTVRSRARIAGQGALSESDVQRLHGLQALGPLADSMMYDVPVGLVLAWIFTILATGSFVYVASSDECDGSGKQDTVGLVVSGIFTMAAVMFIAATGYSLRAHAASASALARDADRLLVRTRRANGVPRAGGGVTIADHEPISDRTEGNGRERA